MRAGGDSYRPHYPSRTNSYVPASTSPISPSSSGFGLSMSSMHSNAPSSLSQQQTSPPRPSLYSNYPTMSPGPPGGDYYRPQMSPMAQSPIGEPHHYRQHMPYQSPYSMPPQMQPVMSSMSSTYPSQSHDLTAQGFNVQPFTPNPFLPPMSMTTSPPPNMRPNAMRQMTIGQQPSMTRCPAMQAQRNRMPSSPPGPMQGAFAAMNMPAVPVPSGSHFCPGMVPATFELNVNHFHYSANYNFGPGGMN